MLKNEAAQRNPAETAADALVRLGHYVFLRRRYLGMDAREDLARAAGISIRVLGDVERGDREVTKPVVVKIEHALGWAPGSAQAVLRGEEAVVLADRPVPVDVLDAIGEMYRIAGKVVRVAARLFRVPGNGPPAGHNSPGILGDRPERRGGPRRYPNMARRRSFRSTHSSRAGRC